MTQESKQLLLKDFCARLPYGVICHTEEGDGHLCSINQTIFGTEYGININPLKRDYFNDSEQDEVVIKPYLRPISSTTEEEEKEYESCFQSDDTTAATLLVDFYNKRHFDYRGLIPMGLALEAKDGMYKTEKK